MLYPLLGSVMTGNEDDMFTIFVKLKPIVFLGSWTKDAYEIILDCYKRKHKLGIIHQHGLSLYSFHFKVRRNNGGEIIWSVGLLYYLYLLGPNFMSCF